MKKETVPTVAGEYEIMEGLVSLEEELGLPFLPFSILLRGENIMALEPEEVDMRIVYCVLHGAYYIETGITNSRVIGTEGEQIRYYICHAPGDSHLGRIKTVYLHGQSS